jgi:hypothetical protein
MRVLVNVLDYLPAVHGFLFQLIPRLDRTVKYKAPENMRVATRSSGDPEIHLLR